MQSWIAGESEVEIIPPKFRKTPGYCLSMSGRVGAFKQTVNLTRVEVFGNADRAKTYDASGNLDRPMSRLASRFTAYA